MNRLLSKGGFLLLIFIIAFKIEGFSQSTYYIGWEEPAIRKSIAAREIKDLITSYTVDGQKTMAWRDMELKTVMIVIFDGLGKGVSCTFLPFTEKDIYEFKVIFNKNHQLIDSNVWISKIGSRSFKISFQFIGGIFKKYGFIITDYDQELRNNKLNELVEKMKQNPVPKYP